MPKVCPHALIYSQIKSGKLKVNLRSPESHRFWAKVDKDGPIHPVLNTRCWEWTASIGSSGYGVFHFQGRQTHASRVSYFLHYGEFDVSLLVCHRCDNQLCVRPEHLFLGTHQDNMTDMTQKMRQATGDKVRNSMPSMKGENNAQSILTDELVRWIRKVYKPHSSVRGAYAISRELGISYYTVKSVVLRYSWKHID